jgi:hypothetical protein
MKDRDEKPGEKAAFGLGIFIGVALTSLVWGIALQDLFAAGLIAVVGVPAIIWWWSRL